MNSADLIDIDRAFDLRILAAIPPTLALFAPQALEMQLREMSRQRRALCFTVMLPVIAREASDAPPVPRIATALTCLHVAPELAPRGVAMIAAIMKRTAESESGPLHELCAPATQAARLNGIALYREAIYAETDISVAVTTHAPVELPAETMAAVAAVTRGERIDLVTTVAITQWRPGRTRSLHSSDPHPILH